MINTRHIMAKSPPGTMGLRRLARAVLSAILLGCPAAGVHAQTAGDCERAGQTAELRYGLPAGLLQAIGHVETGRYLAESRQFRAWPWSVDVDGTARLFDTARDAAQWTQTVSSGNRHSIDVGCFQISLLYHPDAFATLDQAFDPATNADYAARFLASLKDRLGSWPAAVAAYHSADPERGLAYRQRVFAAWSGRARIQDVVAPSETVIPGVHVWTPSPAGFAMAIITLGRPASSALPHIVTPAR